MGLDIPKAELSCLWFKDLQAFRRKHEQQFENCLELHSQLNKDFIVDMEVAILSN